MDLISWSTGWFFFQILLFLCYSVLDGFVLGTAMLIPLAKDPEKKGLLFSAILPFWDIAGVWLIIAGGALFAGFPRVFGTVMSGFYPAIFAIMLGLIFRAVAFEFWHLSKRFRFVWEMSLALASLVITGLLCLALGNVIAGIPLAADGSYNGSILDLLGPFPLTLSCLGVLLALLQGILFAAWKIPEPHGEINRHLVSGIWYSALGLCAFFSLQISINVDPVSRKVLIGFLSGATLVLLLHAKMAFDRKRNRRAFAAASCAIGMIWILMAAAVFPNLVRNSVDPSRNLTLFNSSGNWRTLAALGWVAPIGALLFFGLTVFNHKVFRGKANNHSYY